MPLHNVTVTVRPDGADVFAAPATDADTLGHLAEGARTPADALLFADYSWLRVPWSRDENARGWLIGEQTDFSRSPAYDQVVDAWYEAEDVLALRRKLLQDLLRLRNAPADAIAQVDELRGEALRRLEARITGQAVLRGYRRFWELAERLGLPDPFDYLPVHTAPPRGIHELIFDGFGPTTQAYRYGDLYYAETRRLSPGVDYYVPEGSPLIAVADGVIVPFQFLEHPAERSLALRPYLPERYRNPRGERVLSNVIVAYGHLTGNPSAEIVRVGDRVHAGQIIGTSGWPVYTREDGSVGVQGGNAHLHLQVHLITDGMRSLGYAWPFNPLLFWTPRLVALQARLASHAQEPPYPREGHPYGRLGFFTLGSFRCDLPGNVWQHTPTSGQVWPPGVYTLDDTVARAARFAPYPLDGTSAF